MATHVLGKRCTACNKTRKSKGIAYHPETFMPYCANPYLCNEEHPNSLKNVAARGAELPLLSFEQAKEQFDEWHKNNAENPDRAEQIKHMLTTPTTVRITTTPLAEYILDLKDTYGYDSMADCVRHCIEFTMHHQPLENYNALLPEPENTNEEQQDQPEQQQEAEEETEWTF